MTLTKAKRPGADPCTFCPYRLDVPAGVWSPDEYAKLLPYDGETWQQPVALFLCHDRERAGRVCSGWAGCHDGDELMALRVAAAEGSMTPEDIAATRDYVSPVPLFPSARAAVDHGLSGVADPSPEAVAAALKIVGGRERRRALRARREREGKTR